MRTHRVITFSVITVREVLVIYDMFPIPARQPNPWISETTRYFTGQLIIEHFKVNIHLSFVVLAFRLKSQLGCISHLLYYRASQINQFFMVFSQFGPGSSKDLFETNLVFLVSLTDMWSGMKSEHS
jgi:hypothetical protein